MGIGCPEAGTFRPGFPRELVRRGLRGVELVISDAHEGLKSAVAPRRRPAAPGGAEARRVHGWRRGRRPRHHGLPAGAPDRAALSTSRLERVSGEVKRRTGVVGIFPNDEAVARLVGAIQMEQDDERSVQRGRTMTLETIVPLGDDPVAQPPAVAV